MKLLFGWNIGPIQGRFISKGMYWRGRGIDQADSVWVIAIWHCSINFIGLFYNRVRVSQLLNVWELTGIKCLVIKLIWMKNVRRMILFLLCEIIWIEKKCYEITFNLYKHKKCGINKQFGKYFVLQRGWWWADGIIGLSV